MRRSLAPLAILALALGACSPAGPESSGPSPSDSPSASPSASTSATPSATDPVDGIPNATCQELSFHLDPALAASVVCESVPASADELEPFPAHTRVTLEGYALAGTFHTAHVSVYRVSDYAALLPASFPALRTELAALSAGGAAPAFTGSFGPAVPFLPASNAAQIFFAQYEAAPFASGRGIRYITEYAQYTAMVNNSDLFFTFQGLTDDGQHWVSVVLPVSHPSLMPNSDNPPGGVTWEEFGADYEAYITGAVSELNGLAPETFSPSLEDLDVFVASITVTS